MAVCTRLQTPSHGQASVTDQATVGKVNVDDNPRLAAQYGIRSIPTVLLFQEGQVVDQTVGVVPKQVLTEKLRALVSAAA
jgi:thioredoxin 1